MSTFKVLLDKRRKLKNGSYPLVIRIYTYVARQSHSTIAKKMGYSKDMIAESLGHSIGSAVTDTYLGNDLEVIDAMNEAVCKF